MQKLIKYYDTIVLFIALILCMSKTVEPYCEFTEAQIGALQVRRPNVLVISMISLRSSRSGVMGFYFDNERLADKYGGDTESVDNARATYTNLLNWKGDRVMDNQEITSERKVVVPALNTNDVLTTFSKDLNATSVDLVAHQTIRLRRLVKKWR